MINLETDAPVEQKKMIEEKVDFSKILKELKKECEMSYILINPLTLLDKISENILKDPSSEQYRTLKLGNEKLKEKLFKF